MLIHETLRCCVFLHVVKYNVRHGRREAVGLRHHPGCDVLDDIHVFVLLKVTDTIKKIIKITQIKVQTIIGDGHSVPVCEDWSVQRLLQSSFLAFRNDGYSAIVHFFLYFPKNFFKLSNSFCIRE